MFKKISLFNSVFIIYVFSGLNFLFSFVLQLILAYYFGAKIEMDAYLVAVSIPMIIYGLILSFEAVFVPAFKDLSFKVKGEALNCLINTIFNLFVFILVIITCIILLLSPRIISFLAPGFSIQQRGLTVTLFYIMMPSVIFSGLAAFLSSAYHFREKFGLPAFITVANILVMIITTFLLRSTLGIKSLAWGVLFGSIVQFGILFPVWAFRERYKFIINFKQKELLEICKRILYLSIGAIFLSLILIFEKNLASNLPEGSISVLGYASKVISIVVLFPSFAIPTVLLPQLSKYYALGEIDKLRGLLVRGIRMTFLFIIPLTILLIVFRTPLVILLFKRGAFDSVAVDNTSITIICYLGLMIAMAISKTITMGFLAIHDVIVPSLLMILSFLVYICIAPFLSHILSFKGLALALSFSGIATIVVEFFILRKRLKGIEGKELTKSFLKISLSSLAMGLVSLIVFRALPSFAIMGETLDLVLRLTIATLGGFLVFNIISFMLRLNELRFTYEAVYLRFGSFLKK